MPKATTPISYHKCLRLYKKEKQIKAPIVFGPD
jgi:hypothetical protein